MVPMTESSQIYLITPLIAAPSSISDALEAACATGKVAAVLIRLAAADERTQVNRLKVLVPIIQKYQAAAIVSLESEDGVDLCAIAARGSADGIHTAYDADRLRELGERLKGERSLGVGTLRNRDDAMTAGELGADYVMFGEPRPDGFTPPMAGTIDRAVWWAEIFETPCAAFVDSIDAVEQMAMTGVEFIALGDAVWTHAQGPAAALNIAATILSQVAAHRTECP